MMMVVVVVVVVVVWVFRSFADALAGGGSAVGDGVVLVVDGVLLAPCFCTVGRFQIACNGGCFFGETCICAVAR